MKNISIIMPCFKRVGQTLKTVDLLLKSKGLNQDYAMEVIITDDTPTDELEKALKEKFADQIIYSKPTKQGIAASKNNGARLANNEILIFCDSDMEVEEDTILKTIQGLENHPTAGAIGGQVIWRTGDKDGQLDRPRPEDRTQRVGDTVYTEALYSRYIATYKSVFDQVGGYDEEVFNMRGEGSDLSTRYWRAGFPLVYDESIKVHHVHEVEGGIIRNVAHPEWGIAKDYLLLAYKFDTFDGDYANFAKTVGANFNTFDEGYYRIVEGIAKNIDFICEVKPIVEASKREKPVYDFKFLEIMSNKELFNKCVESAIKRIENVRGKK